MVPTTSTPMTAPVGDIYTTRTTSVPTVSPGAGKRTEAAALEAHGRMTEIKIRLLGDRVSRRTAWQVARQHDWDTLRDAEYIALTRLQADALVTVDPRLAAAAREAVAVASVEDLLTAR